MKGKLYGIGVGPGDPELLTLKAIKMLQTCDVIALPKSEGKEKTAFTIAKQYVGGKEMIECEFAMEDDMEKRKKSRELAASIIIEKLNIGLNVGFITLGDPTTYSTYMYVHKIIAEKGFTAEIIPGITSYTAAAAELGISLCEGDEVLTIIPARHSEDIDKLLEYPGNKVIMKSGKNLTYVLKKLKEKGYENRTMIASRVAMDGQELYRSIAEYEESAEPSYFTIAIVKERTE